MKFLELKFKNACRISSVDSSTLYILLHTVTYFYQFNWIVLGEKDKIKQKRPGLTHFYTKFKNTANVLFTEEEAVCK